MKELKEYTISFSGLKVGKHHFEYHIDDTFFQNFDYEDFNAVDVTVSLNLEKKTTLLELLFEASGTVNVNCDLSNEPFDQAISDSFKLVVKFGDEYNDVDEEILIIPHGEHQINVAQYIYELIVLSIPIKRLHPGVEDGTLDSDIIKKLKELSPESAKEETAQKGNDPRWDNLKKLLTDK
ncbi:DUF177 domain-containing protein [uncultured Winogradskyella sp.]|uniref:YceD family protein n=1 Tax=uncultured Winogradskyella sp. TaxID=395353 RepID=UPI003517B8F8